MRPNIPRLKNLVQTMYLAEAWTEETAAILRFLEDFRPHRLRFRWWHRHFCQSCRDHGRKMDEYWKRLGRGQMLHIPRFDVLN